MFMSTSPELLQRLARRCDGSHRHQPLEGGRARAAAVYPPELCRAILQGIEAQRRVEGEALPEPLRKQLHRGCALYSLGLPTEERRLELDDDVMKYDLEHESDALAKGPHQGSPADARSSHQGSGPHAGPHSSHQGSPADLR